MKQIFILILFIGIIYSKYVQLELSREHIVERFAKDSQFWNKIIKDKWKKLGHQDDIVLDYRSL